MKGWPIFVLGLLLVSDIVDAAEGFIHRTVTRIQDSDKILSWPLFPYSAGSQVWMDDLMRFRTGYLSFPSTQFIALDATDGYWASYSNYRHFESMGSGYPKGKYSFGFLETSGQWTTFNYTATDQLPFAESPVLTNYESLQDLFTDQSFRITWETGRQFGENLRVEVEIRHIRDDGVYPSIYRLSALDEHSPHPAVGEVKIPSGLLEAGNRYQLILRFTHLNGLERNPTESESWSLYTAARSETVTHLGLVGDAPLQPAIAWQSTFELAWGTTKQTLQTPLVYFPVSKEVHLLFAPFDWTLIPAEQISVQGPPGSGFEEAIGSYVLTDPDQTTWYAVSSHSVGFPVIGTYNIKYRGRSYSSDQRFPPGVIPLPLAVPAIELDNEGHISILRWTYHDPATGHLSDGLGFESLHRQSVAIVAHDGSPMLNEFNLGPETRDLSIRGNALIPWKDAEMIAIIAWFEDGTRVVSRYRTYPDERPLQSYFHDGNSVNDWLHVPWLGWMTEVGWPWVWSQRHGFLYLAGSGGSNVYAWLPGTGWTYFNPQSYPFFYSFIDGKWFVF